MRIFKFLKDHNSMRGALTVEACISLPVFLGFFLLILVFIKLACINIVLDRSVCETAKQLAASAYPVSFVNEFEDRIIEEYGEEKVDSLADSIKETAYNTIKGVGQDAVGSILSGNLDRQGIDDILTKAKNDGVLTLKKGIGGYFLKLFEDSYWGLKNEGRYAVVKLVMDKYLDDVFVDKNKLVLRVIALPQGDTEYEKTKDSFEKMGLVPEKDFGRDDVVIQAEYRFILSLPVIGTKSILLRNTAVEKGWLHGGNGVYTQRDEGLDLKDLAKKENLVYVTKTGEKYHKSGCRYLRRSKIVIDRDEAIGKGYTACKICKP